MDAFAAGSPNALDARFGSFVAGAQLFDAAAFGISRPEALYMDPQQRLLLHHAGEALSGLSGAATDRTAVMIGIGPSEYVDQSSSLLPMGINIATGGAVSVAAGR